MIKRIKNKIDYFISKLYQKKFDLDLNSVMSDISFIKNRTLIYNYTHHYFWNLAPDWLRNHRIYFRNGNKGFGEDAFHTMWYYLLNHLKPKNVLEIGVYRGQTISLFGLISKNIGFECNIYGISPFSNAKDSVSDYIEIDYYEDTLKNIGNFNLNNIKLKKGFSNDKEMIEFIDSILWDLIYIDGNHDYDVVFEDFNNCARNLNIGGVIVLDDSALYTDFLNPSYSTKGHPGPSKMALNIDSNYFEEIFAIGHNRVFKKIK